MSPALLRLLLICACVALGLLAAGELPGVAWMLLLFAGLTVLTIPLVRAALERT